MLVMKPAVMKAITEQHGVA